MSKIDNGGPAFPATVQSWNDRLSQCQDGMSLRDWFAGQAMAGLLPLITSSQRLGTEEPNDNLLVSGVAYAMADAMLKARKVQP